MHLVRVDRHKATVVVQMETDDVCLENPVNIALELAWQIGQADTPLSAAEPPPKP